MENINDQILQRIQKAKELRAQGINPYRSKFVVGESTASLVNHYSGLDKHSLEEKRIPCSVAGRIMTLRSFGKATFAHIQDAQGKIQIYLKKDLLGEDLYALFQKLDI